MYNTYDVHFYASFALAMLWPMLELSLQQDVAAAVMSEVGQGGMTIVDERKAIPSLFVSLVCLQDMTMRRLIARGEWRPRKVYGSVPHDMGCPSGVPWKELNSYNLQDVNRWKDLGPKFVLQVLFVTGPHHHFLLLVLIAGRWSLISSWLRSSGVP